MHPEQAILSCMLNDEIASREGASRLRASDFTSPENKRVFEAICKNLTDGIRPDLITVTRICKQDAIYITDLSSMVSSTANYQEYLIAVIEESSLRKVHIAGLKIQAFRDVQEIDSVLTGELTEIRNRLQASDDYSSRATAELSMCALDERAAGRKPGLITPISMLTSYTGGWQQSDMVIIAARPSIGKTAFALACAAKALEQGKAVIFFSLEMSRARLLDRLIIGRSGVDALGYRTGRLSDDEFLRAQRAAGYYADCRLWINDKGSIGLGEIEAFCLTKKKEDNCDLVIVDYLQLMKTRSQKNRTRDGDLAELSRGLKLLAKDLDVPVIVLSQLNREVEKRGNKRPVLSDLRESGAIEQDADLVIMLYRAAYYGEQYVNVGHEEISAQGIGELSISKHRNGETGTIFWTHNDSLTRIGNYPSTDYETVTTV